MFTDGNKNLIITYAIATLVCAILVFVIINFNTWFFPDKKLELNAYTPSSRGVISQEDLKLGVLNDKKFTSLEPILGQNELVNDGSTTTTETVTPSAKPTIELRHSNPFAPF